MLERHSRRQWPHLCLQLLQAAKQLSHRLQLGGLLAVLLDEVTIPGSACLCKVCCAHELLFWRTATVSVHRNDTTRADMGWASRLLTCELVKEVLVFISHLLQLGHGQGPLTGCGCGGGCISAPWQWL
jgi:hypothetical protein